MYNLLDILIHGKYFHEHYAIAPLVVAAIIGAVGSLLSGVLKSKSDSNANTQAFQQSEIMYGQQRADALADWTKQTDYNSPTSQMARLRQANLNPILAAGNITSTSPTVRSSDFQAAPVKSVNPFEGLEKSTGIVQQSLLDQYDVKIKEAQVDNMKTQNTVMLQHQMLEAAQTAATNAMTNKTTAETGKVNVETGMTAFNLQQQQRLADVSAEIQSQNLRKLQADTDFTVHQDDRNTLSNTASVAETAQRTVNEKLQALQIKASTAKTQQEARNAKLESDRINALTQSAMYDNAIKAQELKLRENGLQPHDPLWQRSVKRFLDALLSGGKDPYLNK